MKAKQIVSAILAEQRRAGGGFGAMPTLDKHWLLRWKRDKGVVFRKPNMRFKCSRQVLLKRLRAMWVNMIRIRRLAELCLGHDLSAAIFGVDEKPLHFNESGSKCCRTLEIAGAPAVKLKQNHAATRGRVSVMTCVASGPEAALPPCRLPIELLFKARPNRRIAKLKVPADMNVSLQWAEKGSYRLEHLLKYLKRWLDAMTPARVAAKDYRILLLDVAKSHIGPEISDLCWERGYLVMYHYGCTTGVAQVNDTDLHGSFQTVYMEFEQHAFVEQQLLEPGNVTRTPQDVINDVAATWKVLDHGQAVSGHKRDGLSVKLDGTEDHLIDRDARDLWHAAGMPLHRSRAIAEVDEKVASGLTFADWRSLVIHPDDAGVMQDEGDELEEALAESEHCWLEDADEEAIAALENQDMEDMDKPAEALPLVAAPGDSAGDIVEAEATLKRIDALRPLRAEAVSLKAKAAAFNLDRSWRGAFGAMERRQRTMPWCGGPWQPPWRRRPPPSGPSVPLTARRPC